MTRQGRFRRKMLKRFYNHQDLEWGRFVNEIQPRPEDPQFRGARSLLWRAGGHRLSKKTGADWAIRSEITYHGKWHELT